VRYVAIAVAGLLSALLVASCGSGEKSGAVSTALSERAAASGTTQVVTTQEIVTTAPTPTTVTVTETQPGTTVTTTEQETVERPTTVVQTATVVETAPTPTTTGVSPGAAAVAGAAAASNNTETTEETPWGWIAFGILALAVLVGGAVWWFRRRHRSDAAKA
jgi:cobalamin biosynthesis Mg chelatase CobN